jgi:hypothetical protein
MLIIRKATTIKHASVNKARWFIFEMMKTTIIVLWRTPVVTYMRWTTVVARTSATVWRKATVIIEGSSIKVEASTVSVVPGPFSHPLAVLFTCLVYSVGIPFMIIRPHFAERWPISIRRVDRRTSRWVVVRTGITPLWRRKQLWLHPLHIGQDITAQGVSQRKSGIFVKSWRRTGPQAGSSTTTVGIYDLFSRRIPELRGIWVERVIGILLRS